MSWHTVEKNIFMSLIQFALSWVCTCVYIILKDVFPYVSSVYFWVAEFSVMFTFL